MKVESVNKVDVATLDASKAVEMVGIHPDGKSIGVAVDIFTVLGGFAYGTVLTTEQKSKDSEDLDVVPALSRVYARFPVSSLLEIGPNVIEITPEVVDGRRLETIEDIEEGEWTELAVDCDTLWLRDLEYQDIAS